MEFPDNLRYTKEHEWVRLEDDGTVLVGITDYAQDQLGDIVYVELPDVDGEPVSKDEPLAVVESVKAVSDVYAPVTGVVTEVNDELPNSPEIINQDPYGDGWMVRMKPENEEELEELLTAEEYEALINELS
ncbi:MAG: glycine cleavage system protein GcvH [Candidatus Dadabacteria bacterium]|nr:MAG: glycine cleavage system protein GcvH [Candidatus Dadabacteria bacterium]